MIQLHGRKLITTTYSPINETNILNVLQEAMSIFCVNQGQIKYLFNYYKGIQPILERTKQYHEEINNKIVENHAREIVAFKVGYLLWKPIEYVSRKKNDENNPIETLNDYLILNDKVGKDKELAKHQSICGTSYRLTLENKRFDDSDDEPPFNIYTIFPMNAFVVYSADFKKEPVLGVIVDKVFDEQGNLKVRIQAYTDTMFYEIVGGVLTKNEPHTYGQIPLVEYPLNEERIGDFEQVIELLDAINLTQSNRLDGVEQFIQALMFLDA